VNLVPCSGLARAIAFLRARTGGATRGMRCTTAGRVEILSNSFIVLVGLLGSSMLADSHLTSARAQTAVLAGFAARVLADGGHLFSTLVDSRAGERASISGTQSVKDGDAASFSVTVTGGTAVGYEWSFKAPSGAVNSPSVTFGTPTQASTNAVGHWFALPDRACAPSGDSADPYWNSAYTIVCTVTFSDQRQQKAQTTLTVNAYWNPAGATGTPSISGGPAIGRDTLRNLWVVVDAGTLARNLPTPVIYVPASSQFYSKVTAHENKHVEQWKTGMLSDLYAISSLMAVLSPLTDATQGGLSKKLGEASLAWVEQQDREFQRRLRAAEKEAHEVSDPIAPRYCYQYCGP
jgi:hypothetical protein